MNNRMNNLELDDNLSSEDNLHDDKLPSSTLSSDDKLTTMTSRQISSTRILSWACILCPPGFNPDPDMTLNSLTRISPPPHPPKRPQPKGLPSSQSPVPPQLQPP